MERLYEKGTKIWVYSNGNAWNIATISSISNAKIDSSFHLELLDNVGAPFTLDLPELPPLANPPEMDFLDDLTTLTYLHEPGVLNTIKCRYLHQQTIYTYSGIVLIAVNPFARVPLYSPEIAAAYSGKRRGELDPHLFAVAEDAFRDMQRFSKNQSIIVSGESGAGKTISAKYIMRYFATVGGTDSDTGNSLNYSSSDGNWDNKSISIVEEQVLATNPIMEAFGNAKTTRNDNSSRFGKYIEIQFDKNSKIVGSKIRTYLLERSRVVFQPDNERNYHIFYQLCSGVPSAEKKELALTSPDSFHYLNQGKNSQISGVDDAIEFENTVKALSTVGISVSTQWDMFKLLAAVLHIGNIQIFLKGEKSSVSPDDSCVSLIEKLLGISGEEFRTWIVQKQISTRTEKILTNLTVVQAITSRDAISKYLYHSLFDWLVDHINQSLVSSTNDFDRFIGVLDIYGFEHFKKNSFEQFCINYANEKLQQEFNQHVFKLEQEEYVKEEINWSFINFNDNQPCIELIEGKLGILSLLDEECRLPSGTDSSLISKLYKQFTAPATTKHDSFGKPRFSNSAFTIHHYAYSVDYDVDGFLEKNKDSLPEEILVLLQHSSIDFIRNLFLEKSSKQAVVLQETSPSKTLKKSKQTLGSAFKTSLQSLMETINSTNVHYIRCIKPNEQKTAFTFSDDYVLHQLRACGVLETIRISCAGYPSRFSISDFSERYKMLLHSSKRVEKNVVNCQNILNTLLNDKDKYQIGLTKVFLRAGQLAYLEKCRADRLSLAAILIQKHLKGRIQRKRYIVTMKFVQMLQLAAKAFLSRKLCLNLKRTRAAILVQRTIRMYLARSRFLRTQVFVLNLQRYCRGYLARIKFFRERQNVAAVKIQTIFRGYLSRKHVRNYLRKVITIQCCIRRRLAKNEFKKLRIEAKSIQHVQQKAGALEKKVFELTQLLSKREGANLDLQDQIAKLDSSIKLWKDKHDKILKLKSEMQSNFDVETKKLKAEIEKLAQVNLSLESTNKNTLEKFQASVAEIQKCKLEIERLNLEHVKVKEEVQASVSKKDDLERISQLSNENAVLKEKLAKVVTGRGKPPLERSSQNNQSIASINSYEATNSPTITIASTILEASSSQEKIFSANKSPYENVSGPHSPSSPLSPFHEQMKQHRRHSSLDSAKFESDKTKPAIDSNHGPAPGLVIRRQSIPSSELSKLFNDPGLEKEISEFLILHLPIPPTLPPDVRQKRECLFPAHIIGHCAVQCWRFGFADRFKAIVASTIKHVHAMMNYDDNTVSAFWLSNLYELGNIIFTANISSPVGQDEKGESMTKLVSKAKSDIEFMMMEIYYNWLKELRKKLSKYVVPSIVEHQGLPGYVDVSATSQVGFITKWMLNSSATVNSTTVIPIEKLLASLTKINNVMQSYYMEDSIRRQLLITLIRTLGTSAFNQLLMRKNFCTWRRGMQIQYNVTRIEEWCTQNEVGEASLHMEPIMQAAKLLQLNKSSTDDLDIIVDVCFLLSPLQIKKILTMYNAGEYDEHPVSSEILKAASSRCTDWGGDSNLLLETSDDTPFIVPQPINVPVLEKFIPSYIASKLIVLKHVVDISF